MKTPSQRYLLLVTAAFLILAAPAKSFAGSATWAMDPFSGDWKTAQNWMPNTVPNDPNDVAKFGKSELTNISISGVVEIDGITYESDANSFATTLEVGGVVRVTGAGFVNQSGAVQAFFQSVTEATTSLFLFYNSATAGDLTVIANPGGELDFSDTSNAGKAAITISGLGSRQGHLTFGESSSAAQANIATNGFAFTTFLDNSSAAEAVLSTSDGGGIDFGSSSSVANAIVRCDGGTASGRGSGGVGFNDNATAAEGHFTINGAAVAGAIAAHAIFDDSSTAGNGTFQINGSAVAGAQGGFISFYENTTAGNASLTINGGSSGGEGGALFFFDQSTGGTASIGVFGNGQMDIGNRAKPGVTIGSLEGDGLVFLGAKALVVGSNNRNTSFAGVIQDGGINQGTGGSLTKMGTGTLKLGSASTYSGGTTLAEGSLAVWNTTGSGTGAGPVQVNGGTLAGAGVLAGAVTIGSGSGAGALLAPSQGAGRATTLTLQSSLTFKADATYRYRLNLKKAKSDLVVANGVTIESGAQFNFQAIGRGRLRPGKVATVLSNTSATPIAGAFANLPDGATLEANGNILLVSYHGGDGNDLTLKVVR